MPVSIRLVDKEDKQVVQDDNYTTQGQLSLPRVINHNELIYRFDRSEGHVKIYKQADR